MTKNYCKVCYSDISLNICCLDCRKILNQIIMEPSLFKISVEDMTGVILGGMDTSRWGMPLFYEKKETI